MKTEQEILEKAFLLFLQDGFSAVSTNEIIREAGVTKGGFYYVFKSREDLVQKVVARYIIPFFTYPKDKMEEAWQSKKQNSDTETLLWDTFFVPQQFTAFCRYIGMEVSFRDFYLLMYDGMKKFPQVEEHFSALAQAKGACLASILERGKERREVAEDIDLKEYIPLIIAMQEGILALRVLDEQIQEDEKYRKIQKQVMKDIGVQMGSGQGVQGGARSAVS